MRSIATLTLALYCVSIPAAAKNSAPAFDILTYRLPSAEVSARISLTLESCQTIPIVSGEAVLVADATATPDSFTLNTKQLDSARIKRNLKITLHETGTIASIDSATVDRTGSIFGNVIRFAASVAGAFFGFTPKAAAFRQSPSDNKKSMCAEPILAAIARVNEVDRQLSDWRSQKLPGAPKDAEAQSSAIDALAAERAALRVGPLYVDLQTSLPFSKLVQNSDEKTVWITETAFDMTSMQKAWLKEGQTAPAITMAWRVTLPGKTSPPAADGAPAAKCAARLAELDGKGICFVRPLSTKISAKATASNMQLKNTTFTLEAQRGFPIPQWGELNILSLSTGFGGNKQLSLTLDKFGRVSAMQWSSEARAETVTGGLAGLAEQAAGFAAANSEAAKQKREIDELSTQQALNRLRACREILNAGGSACPADAPTGGPN